MYIVRARESLEAALHIEEHELPQSAPPPRVRPHPLSVFPMSVVVGAAVPAAVCRWGLCSRCPGMGRCLWGVNIIICPPSPPPSPPHHPPARYNS